MNNLLLIAGAALAAQYVLGPPLLRLTYRQSANAQFHPIELANIDANTQQVFARVLPVIQQEGFTLCGYLWTADLAPNVSAAVAILVHRASGVICNVPGVTVGTTGKFRTYVEFTSRFSEESYIGTNNNPIAGMYARTPKERTYRFPALQDPALLYRLHLQLCTLFESGQRAVLPAAGGELDYFAMRVRMDLEKQIAAGYYGRDGDQLHLTWKGAIVFGWKAAFPVMQVRSALMARQSRALLRKMPFAMQASL
jgi:hypothetical protein